MAPLALVMWRAHLSRPPRRSRPEQPARHLQACSSLEASLITRSRQDGGLAHPRARQVDDADRDRLATPLVAGEDVQDIAGLLQSLRHRRDGGGLEGYGLEPGCRADFVLLEARDPVEAIRLRATRLAVVRGGRVIARTPSAAAALDLPGRPATTRYRIGT